MCVKVFFALFIMSENYYSSTILGVFIEALNRRCVTHAKCFETLDAYPSPKFLTQSLNIALNH